MIIILNYLGRSSLVWLISLLLGCSSLLDKQPPPVASAELETIISGQAILGHEVSPEELPDLDLFALTPEMASFAQKAVRHAEGSFAKVRALHYALLLPESEGGRGIVYDAYATRIPSVAFQERRVNCLSFSLLYVAMAQHLKLNAKINEVETPPTWNLRDKDSFFLMRHVNVKIPLRERWISPLQSDEAVVDLEMGRYKPSYMQRYISTELAAAQFYNNRGMELASEGKINEAFLYLRKALAEDDQQSYIWNNFASLYLKKNLQREAELIYQHGLKLNPNDLTIMTNLAGFYRKNDNPDKAAKFSKLAQQYRQSNPFYQYALALSAFDEKDYRNALLYVKRALEREQNEPRFYQLAADAYTQLGELDSAEAMMKKHKKLSK